MPIEKEVFTIAIAGNPNCGKTALFNSLTGSNQIVGNWPGVTVEKKEGSFKLDNHTIRVVDLPGIYALFANSEDECAALDYLLKGEADLVVNILDATNLERNLFLTSQLMEKGVPMVIAVNMMDIAIRRGITIYLKKLEEILGVTAIALSAVSKESCEGFVNDLHKLLHNSKELPVPKAVKHSDVLEKLIAEISVPLMPVAEKLGASPRWTAVQYLEHSGRVLELANEMGVEIPHDKIEEDLGEEVEFALADSRYSYARNVASEVVRDSTNRKTNSDKIDKFFLNRILGIPLFLVAMYLVFWLSVTVGSAFIDFFDILFGGVFVDGVSQLLQKVGAPGVLVALLANGVGAGAHGRPHYGKQARTFFDDVPSAVHELRGATPCVCVVRCGVFWKVCRECGVCDLHDRYCCCAFVRAALAAYAFQGRRIDVHHGTSAIPFAAPEKLASPCLASLARIYLPRRENRRHHGDNSWIHGLCWR